MLIQKCGRFSKFTGSDDYCVNNRVNDIKSHFNTSVEECKEKYEQSRFDKLKIAE